MGKLNTLKDETDQLYTDILKTGELKWNWNWILSIRILYCLVFNNYSIDLSQERMVLS